MGDECQQRFSFERLLCVGMWIKRKEEVQRETNEEGRDTEWQMQTRGGIDLEGNSNEFGCLTVPLKGQST